MALALNHFGTPAAGDTAVALAAAGTAMVSATALAPAMRRSTRLADVIMFASTHKPDAVAGKWHGRMGTRPCYPAKRQTTTIT
jgi:hypothetical protein